MKYPPWVIGGNEERGREVTAKCTIENNNKQRARLSYMYMEVGGLNNGTTK